MNAQSNDFQVPTKAARRITLQWHITDRCNLRCKHCYQESYISAEQNFDQLLEILAQYKNLLTAMGTTAGRAVPRGHITLSGGEPFFHNDFLELLEHISADSSLFSFSILSNGHFIDAKMAVKLASLKPAYVQISIEGTADTHDAIRGEGSYQEAIGALGCMVKVGLRTVISFTAHQDNYQEFAEVARLGRRLGVARVWADRQIPCGSGLTMQNKLLTVEQTHELFEIMQRARKENAKKWFNKTEISMRRALQFLEGGGKPYKCTAGDTLITIMPNGDLYPCRRMPIACGNVMETSLLELYSNNELFRKLRAKENISEECKSCFYGKLCQGGLKCLSYAVTGDPFAADPGCWLAKGIEL